MYIFNRSLIALGCLSAALLAGCSEDGFESLSTPPPGGDAPSGVISQNNFSILASDWAPQVIQDDGSFTQTDVTLTVFTGTRNNEATLGGHTISFESEYGLINPPTCVTDETGSCEVTWSATKDPRSVTPPVNDFRVTVTAYALGEEAFTDSNGNGLFDDGDAGFEDIEEPYLDANYNSSYNASDKIIDVVSTNDPTGQNLAHDIADGFFNGGGCTHTSLCGARTSVIIWDDIELYIDGPPAAP